MHFFLKLYYRPLWIYVLYMCVCSINILMYLLIIVWIYVFMSVFLQLSRVVLTAPPRLLTECLKVFFFLNTYMIMYIYVTTHMVYCVTPPSRIPQPHSHSIPKNIYIDRYLYVDIMELKGSLSISNVILVEHAYENKHSTLKFVGEKNKTKQKTLKNR